MRWIGQNIYDLISRFRNDVYLEDLTTTTETNVLVVDSTGKISKSTSLADDIIESEIDTLAALTAIGTAANTLVVTNDIVRFDSTNANDPLILIKNKANDATSGRLRFLNERGADGQDNDETGIIEFFSFDDGTPSGERYARIIGTIHDASTTAESGKLSLQVASHDGGDEDGLVLTGGSVDAEVDVTIGNGAASVTTLSGTLTMGSTATINNSGVIQVAAQTVIDHDQLANFSANEHYAQEAITTVGTIGAGVWNGTAIAHAYIGNDAIDGDNLADEAVDSEHYTDGSIDTAHIADDQVTFAKALGVTPNVYGNIIKLLPTDFMDNGDGGNGKFGVGYTDSAGTGYGMRVPNGATEMYAFVSIPQGMKATHVDIFDKTNLAVEVFEVQINATTMVSKGSGNANTTIDITDVNATATNMLAIEVTTTATTNRVYGGSVTIAAQ